MNGLNVDGEELYETGDQVNFKFVDSDKWKSGVMTLQLFCVSCSGYPSSGKIPTVRTNLLWRGQTMGLPATKDHPTG
jgi:hypothetical protein